MLSITVSPPPGEDDLKKLMDEVANGYSHRPRVDSEVSSDPSRSTRQSSPTSVYGAASPVGVSVSTVHAPPAPPAPPAAPILPSGPSDRPVRKSRPLPAPPQPHRNIPPPNAIFPQPTPAPPTPSSLRSSFPDTHPPQIDTGNNISAEIIRLTPDEPPPDSPVPPYAHHIRDDPRAISSLGGGPLPPLHDDTEPQSYPGTLIRGVEIGRVREPMEALASPFPSSAGHMDPDAEDQYLHRRPSTHRSEVESRLSYYTPEVAPVPAQVRNYSQNIPRAMQVVNNDPYAQNQNPTEDWATTGQTNLTRRPSDQLHAIIGFDITGPTDAREECVDEEGNETEEEEVQYVNYSLLSNLAVLLRDKVPRGIHVKGSVPYPRAFTGKDIVSTIHSHISRELIEEHGGILGDRRAALQIARTLQNQLFFYEVEWDGSRIVQDGVEDVYMFLDDEEGSNVEREGLPTGVVTFMTRCYSLMCERGRPCYSSMCPRKGQGLSDLPTSQEISAGSMREEWSKTVSSEFIRSLPEKEINRQTIIHKIISKEEQYIRDLDIVESVFIKPLRNANPPVIPSLDLDEFVDEVFSNILDIRECNRRLLEVLRVRQREQAPVIQGIGDIFLEIATEFRLAYPEYIGRHPIAEKRMRDELEQNPEFRLFMEKCSRNQSARPGLDLRHFLNRPGEHLQKYPVLLEAILHESDKHSPDAEFLSEAIQAIKDLQSVSQLRTFQSAMGKGNTGKWEWHDLVTPQLRRGFTMEEEKRQAAIFELIKGEMAYVKDLENIETMYIRPLRDASPPIIPRDRLDHIIQDVFHNFGELYVYHHGLVEKLHSIQRDEHPRIRSVTAAVFDAALNFREAYMEYIPNYPIAEYRIDDEIASNPAFKDFVNQCIRHPDSHRLDMKNFINRPIPRLLRYELLLKAILAETPAGHEDRNAIPQVIEVIKTLGREAEPGVASAKQKVELWKYNSNLVFKSGEIVDMDLLNEQRSLIHTGKLLRQPESGLEFGAWNELFVLLFDNYLVMTKPKDKDGVTKYHVTRRPIPLDLLTLVSFSDSAALKSSGLLRNLRGSAPSSDSASVVASSTRSGDNSSDPRLVFPFTIHQTGRLGGPYILFAESSQCRTEWKHKLEEALGLRKVVQESNKVFEIETLSMETFYKTPASSAWSDPTDFTGKVSCSVPFNTPDGRGLVAIGCEEGVWIGFRRDSRSMRRVLHLTMVTQCAILDEFSLFLVLADKQLFAYHLEALVPTNPNSIYASPHTRQKQYLQKLNGSKEVQFFSVGIFQGRTLVIYMRKRGNESVFRALEPVIDKINERPRASSGGFPSIFRLPRSSKVDWFRDYREFSLQSDAYDLIFLKARIAILCAKGFEFTDMAESVTIPQRDDPRQSALVKRCESCRALGMFRRTDDEFLLCFTEFGIFVNKRGDPSRGMGIIEWEGTAKRVALHSPYILLFDPQFIEVRHLDNARLTQIIPGQDIRCIWDGRNIDSSAEVTPAAGTDEDMGQEPRVHAVMTMSDPLAQHNNRPARGAVCEHIFELVPTIPLYLPGSLASPSAMTYFPPGSFAPPRSPRLRSSSSYR